MYHWNNCLSWWSPFSSGLHHFSTAPQASFVLNTDVFFHYDNRYTSEWPQKLSNHSTQLPFVLWLWRCITDLRKKQDLTVFCSWVVVFYLFIETSVYLHLKSGSNAFSHYTVLNLIFLCTFTICKKLNIKSCITNYGLFKTFDRFIKNGISNIWGNNNWYPRPEQLTRGWLVSSLDR